VISYSAVYEDGNLFFAIWMAALYDS